MIVSNQNVVSVTSSQQFNTIKLGVSRTGFSHLRDIVSNFIYSDKILAPIREYSTNAVDAHKEKGIADRPILVRLPNTVIPTFAVRDYGYGLSREQIVNVFANYGESTKRGSNDAIGMLGIGSKSAFAYGVKSFMVISYQNGKKTTYVVSIEQSVDGDIVEFDCSDTNEEDGLEVQFGVKTSDISSFLNKATSFFQHWSVMPVFEGNTLNIRPIEKLYSGNNWYLTNTDTGCKLLMGNIVYSLTYENVRGKHEYNSQLASLVGNMGLVLSAPIGSVDIAASRETLQYTERTQKYVYELLINAHKELIDQVVKLFESLTTTFEKKCMLSEFQQYSSPLYRLSPVVGNVIRSKYNTVYDCCDNVKHGFRLYISHKSKRGNRRVRTNELNGYNMECAKNIAYVIADVNSTNYNRQLAPLIEKTDNYLKRAVSKVYLIKVTDAVLFDNWCKANEFDVPLIKLKDLPIVKMCDLYPSTSTKNPYVNTNVNNRKKVLELVMDGKTGSEYFQPWNSSNNTNEPTVFVVIDKYRIKTSSGNVEPCNFIHDLVSFCKEFGIKLPKIAAVRVNDVTKLDDKKYVSLYDYVVKLINNDNNILKKISDSMVSLSASKHKINTSSYFSNTCNVLANNIKLLVSTDSIAFKYISSYIVQKDMSFMSYFGGVNVLKCHSEVEQRIKELKNMFVEFIKHYPMIQFVDFNLKYDNQWGPLIIDYINFVDSCRNIKPVDKSVSVV